MRVLLSCGGTGGHIYPAIAIADKIKERYPDAQILFVGTKQGMENRLVPAAGYEIKGVKASGFKRRNLFKNVNTIKDAVEGGKEVDQIISEFKPDIAIGTGAYVTGVVLLHAHRNGVPCVIHEQNAVPGLTNKILSQFVDKVFISFKDTEKFFAHPNRVIYSGNPIRSDFEKLDREKCREELGYFKDDIVVLATGGSLGAEVVNNEVIDFAKHIDEKNIKLIFVTGKRYYDDVKGKCNANNLTLLDYANNMPTLMKAADLVISRAGAIAVSEILASGKASILVPSPNVTNNHQYHNAKAIADEGAAVLIEEKDLLAGEEHLASEIMRMLAGSELSVMGERAKAIACTNAADIIVKNIIENK